MIEEPCKRCGEPIEMAVTVKRRRWAVEPAPPGVAATLVLLPPNPGSGYPERQAFAPSPERPATHRRHVCAHG